MLALLTLVACWGDGANPPASPPPPENAAAVDGPLPEPALGVREVVTPPEVIRPTEVQDRAAPPLLDVRFDPDVTTFDALGQRLESWGFTLLDGDGESWRIGAPAGAEWAARLVPLPGIAQVSEAVDLVAMENGAFREGSERFGTWQHTWAWREGGPVEKVAGGTAPPTPVLPHALPAPVVRCLSPARADMAMGVSVGLGWERALIVDPPTWVLVLEDYGACKASGFVRLRADAPVDTLSIGGRPLDQVDSTAIQTLAAEALQRKRTYSDPAGIAAWDLLRQAPDATLATALRSMAPGPLQDRVWEELDRRDHETALTVAAETPDLQDKVTAEDETLRTRALTDPKAPADAQYAALTVWRPGPSDPPEILERLRSSASPRVREKAWELTLDASMDACMERARTLDKADVSAATRVYRECPQQPVRSPAFQRVAALDKVAAGAMVRVVLEDPETVRTGIAAVRHAAALERMDLLEATVRRMTLPRDMRRVALELMVKAEAPVAGELVEQHGHYLGYRGEPGVPAVTAAEP